MSERENHDGEKHSVKGMIFDMKEFGIHDGPGLRTTVFLKGCPLRCIWCHNPEGLATHPQLTFRKKACVHCGACQQPCPHPECQPYGRCLHVCPQNLLAVSGEELTAEELVGRLLRNRSFWGEKGGVTFSGGEPLLQAEFVRKTADLLGKEVHKAIETSGYAEEEIFCSVISKMNLVYMDLKLADDQLHKKYTGVSNQKILRNMQLLKASKIPCVIRTPLIPGITDTQENLRKIRELTDGMEYELLPFNHMAGAKYDLLGWKYPYEKWEKE